MGHPAAPFRLCFAALLLAFAGQGHVLPEEEGESLSLLQLDPQALFGGGLLKSERGPEHPHRADFWASSNGDLRRTGASAFTAPRDLSRPTWTINVGGLVRATPLINEHKEIYFTTVKGVVRKMSAQREFIWNFSAKAMIPGSPALAGGSIFLAARTGEVMSVDAETGTLRWRRKVAACLAKDGGSVTATTTAVVVAAGEGWPCAWNSLVIGLDATTGAELWEFKLQVPVHNFMSSVVRGHSEVVRDRPRHSVVFSDSSGRVYRVDLLNGHALWQYNDTDPNDLTTGGAVVGPNNLVYVASNVRTLGNASYGAQPHGRLTALDVGTGKPVWKQDVGLEANSAPAVGFLLPGGKGDLSVVMGIGENPDPPRERSASAPDAPPKPVMKQGAVVAFEAQSGRRLGWKFTPPPWNRPTAAGDQLSSACMPESFSSPSIGADGTVYIGSMTGHLYALRDADGNHQLEEDEVSAFDAKHGFHGNPAIAPGMLVATPCNRMLVFKEAAA